MDAPRLALALLVAGLAGCRDGVAPYEPPPDPGSDGARQLTYSRDRDQNPSWSADGDSLYYGAMRLIGFPGRGPSLYRIHNRGGAAGLLLPSAQLSPPQAALPPIAVPAVSPDGSRVAYVQLVCVSPPGVPFQEVPCVAEGETIVAATLRVRDAAAPHPAFDDPGIALVLPRLSALDELTFRPSWAPDSRRLVFTDSLGLYTWQPGEGAPSPIPGTAGARSAAWSPDGDAIAFAQGADPAASVRVVELADGSRDVATGGGPSWSPDGGSIFFHTAEGIRRVARAGGASEAVPNTSGGLMPAVSPDGRWLAFTREKPFTRDADIWVVPLR